MITTEPSVLRSLQKAPRANRLAAIAAVVVHEDAMQDEFMATTM